jgi:hypothetical protein
MQQALGELRATALPLCDANGRALRRSTILARQHPEFAAELLRALARGPLAVHADERYRRTAMIQIGMIAPKLCLEALGSFRTLPRWQKQELQFRAVCLKSIGAPDAASAASDYLDYLDNEAASLAASAPQARPLDEPPSE